jgi:DNA mismatch endonuclease, patch repair protein
MEANRRVDTKPERLLRSALHARGLRFRKDRRLNVAGRWVRPDIVFGPARLAVFVDGCFWHGCPAHGRIPVANRNYWAPKLARNVERDREADDALRTAGWSVLRFWEHVPPDEAADAVRERLSVDCTSNSIATTRAESRSKHVGANGVSVQPRRAPVGHVGGAAMRP